MARFDQLVDSLAFGRAKPKTGTCLGLYISPDLIYIAETHRDQGGKLIVDHLVRIQVPRDGKEVPANAITMNTDFLSDPKRVGRLISESMAQMKWNSKDVVVTLSHHSGLLRYFPMPAVERRFLKSAVPIEAKKYIPLPFESLVYDYQVVPMAPDPGGRPRKGILIAVSQKNAFSNVVGLLKTLNLNLVGLEVAPCSVMRLWQSVDSSHGSAPFVQAQFDAGGVRILIGDQGLPVFFREVFLGGEATISDQRKIDLSGCIAFVQKQLGLGRIAKIYLSGVPALLDPWRSALTQETGLPTEIQDTAKLLTIKGADWGGCAAIGASVRPITPSPLTLDLAALDRITDEERQTARDILLVGIAAAVLIGIAGLFSTLSYKFRARVLDNYKIDPDIRMMLSGLPPSELEAKLKEMREQLEQVRAVSDNTKPRLSQIIGDIVELLPDNVWLSMINVSNPLGGDKGGVTLIIRGRARGASVSIEQSLASDFKDALLRSDKIGRNFDIQFSLETQRTMPSQIVDQGLDPGALARKLEERTEFAIELRAKH